MKFIYGRQDFKTLERGEENCYLMTNGLGGFSSLSMTGSCARNDHGVLISCDRQMSPNHRYNMIHRLEERLTVGQQTYTLSSQRFTDGREEEGYRWLTSVSFEDYPVWNFLAAGVEVKKKILLAPGENTVAISYEFENHSGTEAVFTVRPWMEFVPKGAELAESQSFLVDREDGEAGSENLKGDSAPGQKRVSGTEGCRIESGDRRLYCRTDGRLSVFETRYDDGLYYAYDACDGRRESGTAAADHEVTFRIPAGRSVRGNLLYSTEEPEGVFSRAAEGASPDSTEGDDRGEAARAAEGASPAGAEGSGQENGNELSRSVAQIEERIVTRRRELVERAGLGDETAQTLVKAADQFISWRASTGGKTILAGFPFFEDWGRDTMIALTGCCLSTGRYETAESILRTFMRYLKDGLMPNLFPEGECEPRYNTVDAALLFILAVYEYDRRTGNKQLVKEAWPVMKDIVEHYISGTEFSIGMDTDGLIRAGKGFDQVTWMDVRVGDILPTPRHGKPVEINAYWYNALCIMDFFSGMLRESAAEGRYRSLAELVKKSFREKFWNEEKKCLKDVLSDPEQSADRQLRCNQIWAVSLPFSLLERERERQVVEAVFEKLYTPLGLRTLEPEDEDFHPCYGGGMLERDLAYHQGTVWVFPLGAYYLAYLKVNDFSGEARDKVKEKLQSTAAALREGCAGQLPEIYDGLFPASSRGCFAQAWSVGEMLRVYEALETEPQFPCKPDT